MFRSALLRSINVLVWGLRNGYNTRFHSEDLTISGGNMKIRIISALKDNYMFLVIDEKTKQCAVVDPVEADKVIAAAKEENVTIDKVLTTHHHWDHASGNDDLKAKLPDVHVYGGDDRINALMTKVKHGDKLQIGSLNVECMETPCHTTGHICYNITSADDDPAVFTGDTLFSAGCGRFFEGTPPQMYHALIDVLGSLPPHTRVFCGHEYTVASLKFAAAVEPDNQAVKDRAEWALDKRSRHEPTIPSTIADEYSFNPFMRVQEKSVQDHVGSQDPIKVMGALREEKNNF